MTTTTKQTETINGVTINVTRDHENTHPGAARIADAIRAMNRADFARAAYDAGNIFDTPALNVTLELDIIDAGPNALSRVGDIATIFAASGPLEITAEVEINEPHAEMIENALSIVADTAERERDATR